MVGLGFKANGCIIRVHISEKLKAKQETRQIHGPPKSRDFKADQPLGLLRQRQMPQLL